MQTTEADMKAASEMATIVKLTNRTDFDFTPEMGARFGGMPHLIRAGESRLYPKPVAKLLAKHLARQVFIRKAPLRDANETDGRGKDRPLWGIQHNMTSGALEEIEVEAFAEKMFLSDAYTEEVTRPKTFDDLVSEKIENLNKTFPVGDDTPSGSSYKDKAEVIAELEKRGVSFDRRQSKANLEKLLT